MGVRSLFAAALCALTPAAAGAHFPQLPASQNSQCGSWTVVRSPNGPSLNSHLYSVNGIATNDVWAVGSREESGASGIFRTLVERWDGADWSVVPSPNIGEGDDDLAGVAALSKTNVWAVGISNARQTSTPRTLVEHWNGRAWSIVPSPSLGQLSALGSIMAVAANDIWAGGFYVDSGGNDRTLVEHWNGSTWSIVPSPNPGLTNDFIGTMAASSPSDIWAVGTQSSNFDNSSQTLVEHWNGRAWTVVPSPSPGTLYNSLGGVTEVSATDIWAVGQIQNTATIFARTLTEHWDGRNWTVVPSPNLSTSANGLSSVAHRSSTDVWAVGAYFLARSGISRTLVERWNGQRWSVEPSPNPGGQYDQLYNITAVSTDLWSVGVFARGSNGFTLTEFHC